MPLSIKELADLAGVSTRTLRYYDQIGLLKPSFLSPADYRMYTTAEIDQLQHILFLKELDFNLQEIKRSLAQDPTTYLAQLKHHQLALAKKEVRLKQIRATLAKTIAHYEGELTMTSEEKFAAFKQELVASNEEKYGGELRQRYDEALLAQSQDKVLNWQEADYDAFKTLEAEILSQLEVDFTTPSTQAETLFLNHRQWLRLTWAHYTPAAHQGLAQLYLINPAFQAYYDTQAGGGATEKLVAVIKYYTAT